MPRRRSHRTLINFEIADVLAYTATVIRTHGWISKGASTSTGATATSERVLGGFDAGTLRPKADRLAISRTDKATAAAARLWAEAQSGSEYANKIAELANEDTRTITNREIGLVCSIVGCFHREQTQRAEQAERGPGRTIGTIGNREVFTATLVSVREIGTRFGASFLHKFDSNGAEVVWFASRPTSGMAEGCTYKLRGTVKKHGEFRGTKNTTVNRVTVIAELDVPRDVAERREREAADALERRQRQEDLARQRRKDAAAEQARWVAQRRASGQCLSRNCQGGWIWHHGSEYPCSTCQGTRRTAGKAA